MATRRARNVTKSHSFSLLTISRLLLTVLIIELTSSYGASHRHHRVDALSPVRQMVQQATMGYKLRVQADPQFPKKSVTELVLAVSTQFIAEVQRRGTSRILAELDFVVPGLLTAMAGKYYSMWRVAPTKSIDESTKTNVKDATLGGMAVPTNAFQPTLLDGKTSPTLLQRCGSFIVPIPNLFQAGCLAGLAGYGSTAMIIALRSLFLPSYEAATQNVNVLYASVYTGAFVAIVSNLRYQILQGVIEPKFVDKIKDFSPILYTIVLFMVRTGNGLLGANLAIRGMRWFGVQQLKG